MAGSTADTPATPEFLRASDAERDEAVSELRNEFAEGRLSQDTFMHRMHSALGARNHGQLVGLFTDLPPRRPPLLARVRAALRRLEASLPGREAGRGPDVPETRRITAAPPGPALLVFPPGSGPRFTIGRANDCDLRLTDLSVSRSHALLMRKQDGWVLSDLGSHNGTRLNGWLVREPVPVRAGDRVEFGSAVFVLADAAPQE